LFYIILYRACPKTEVSEKPPEHTRIGTVILDLIEFWRFVMLIVIHPNGLNLVGKECMKGDIERAGASFVPAARLRSIKTMGACETKSRKPL
jgi:hypothetical protein